MDDGQRPPDDGRSTVHGEGDTAYGGAADGGVDPDDDRIAIGSGTDVAVRSTVIVAVDAQFLRRIDLDLSSLPGVSPASRPRPAD